MRSNTTFRRWEVHRPPAKPPSKLPFWIEYAGHYQSASGFQSDVSIINFIQVFWCAAGEGTVVIAGRERIIHPGQVALYFPGMEHRYYAAGKNWDIYWWTMHGMLAPSIVAAFGLNANVYNAGPPPVRLFRALARALRNPAPYGEAQAVNIAFQLLVRAGFSHVSQTDDDIAGIADHINANWNKPTLNIKHLASTMNINRACLSRRFHKSFGISPGEYIARLRIQNALSMLTGTKKSVMDIAASCGYLDRRYFARLLKKRLGASPLRLRKNAAVGR